jgi:Polysaccharide biosynthesis
LNYSPIIRSLVFIFLWTTQVLCDQSALLPKLHVCTVANWMHPNLKLLLQSCKEHGISLEILGMDQPYHQNTDKLRWMKKYCSELSDDELILFVDAFDVLVLADAEEIAARFVSLNVPMLMAAELNCYPPDRKATFPLLTTSPFRYLNTGCYIGWAKAVKNWLASFDEKLLSDRSDQRSTYKLFTKKPNLFAIDHWCQIFLCLFNMPKEALEIDAANRQVHCAYTHSSPCILHANGRSFSLWHDVYASFFESEQPMLYKQLRELVALDPNQLTIHEYTYLANLIQDHAPCNILVFGLGNDSKLWHELNANGKTVFLEHNVKWYKKIMSETPELTSCFVEYHTKLEKLNDYLDQDPEILKMDLPTEIMKTHWDIIFVDAPEGYDKMHPGRMQSIYMASILGRLGHSHILVHDYYRKAEKICCSRFLSDAKKVRSIERLRHYKFEVK